MKRAAPVHHRVHRTLAGLAASLTLLTACQEELSDEQRVARAFEAYKSAVIAGDGATASGLLDGDTLVYYERLLTNIRDAEAESIRKLPPTERLQVLHYRAVVPSQATSEWAASDLFAFGIATGLVDRDGLRKLELGEIRVTGDRATADVHGDGQVEQNAYAFSREASGWKVRLTDRLNEADDALRARAEEAKVSVDDLILQFLEVSLGKPAPASVWSPLRSPPAAE